MDRAHWQLVILCLTNNVVVWFCSLSKKKNSHILSGGYECGYYVMHWMWNIISGELKTDWTMWFGDGTPLDIETMTTLRKKWAAYFLKVSWDVSVFGVYNDNFPLYIKHEDLSEIAHSGFNNSQGRKSNAATRWIVVKCNKQKGSIRCRYYLMHWMSTIVLEGFKDNWETYFVDQRPLESERMKAILIQWAKYHLKDISFV
ncbi:hypothetical protein HKD37_14G040013 [Glycine soja]